MNSTHATRFVQQPEWPICSTFFSDDAIALVYTTTTTSDCCCGCLKLQQPAPLKIRKEKKKFDIFRHGINVTRSGHYSVRRWRSTSFLPFLYKRCGLPPLKKKKKWISKFTRHGSHGKCFLPKQVENWFSFDFFFRAAAAPKRTASRSKVNGIIKDGESNKSKKLVGRL